MHKRFFIPLAIILFLSVFYSCSSSKHTKTKRLPGMWQEKPIVIDGYNTDWPSPYPEYDDKAMLGYIVSNDKENLYITVETGDDATQLKILREGLTVWIDKQGEKNELTAINYPLPTQVKPGDGANRKKPSGGRFQQDQPGTGGGNQEQKKRMELEERVRALLPEATEYSLQGFKSCNLQYPLLENDSCGIRVRIAIDSDNEMVWEAVIPFRTFYFKPEISRPDKGKPLSICFETTAMKRPAGEGSGNGNGNNGGGGGIRPSFGVGGYGGMGMSMGGGRGGHSGNRSTQQNTPNIMESAYKSTKTWKTFGIAYPN